MRILSLGSFSRPYDTELYIAKSFALLGHSVKCVDVRRAPEWTQDEEFDFAILSKRVSQKTFKSLTCPTVGWYFDLYWGTERQHVPETLFQSDFVFTTDGGHDAEWKNMGVNHHLLRQGIFGPEAIRMKSVAAEDIIFVGTNQHSGLHWRHRGNLLLFLRDTYKERFVQHGFPNEVRGLALNRLFASSKVVMGDSVYSPFYWSNRIYETLGRGGFLLFPDIPGLSDDFTPYKHFVPYEIGKWNELEEKINFYLTHDSEREKIRRQGFEHVKKNHTYTRRCEELIKIVLG